MSFVGLYQPKVNIHYDVVSYEALIKPVQDVRTDIYVNSIEDKESFDISVIEYFVNDLHQSGISLPISINVFSNSFYSDRFIRMCERSVGKLNFLLEITEHESLREPNRAKEAMNYLNQIGIEFSLDDYGAGYSDEKQLRSLPFVEVKFDKSLIHSSTESFSAFRNLHDEVKKIKDMGIERIVYEGIENEKMEALVLACDPNPILQGFYYSKLRPISDFVTKTIKPVEIINLQTHPLSQPSC